MTLYPATGEGVTNGRLQWWLSTLPQPAFKLLVSVALAVPVVFTYDLIALAQAFLPSCQPRYVAAGSGWLLQPAGCQVQAEVMWGLFSLILALGGLAAWSYRTTRTTDLDVVKAANPPRPTAVAAADGAVAVAQTPGGKVTGTEPAPPPELESKP